jgi:hypothetical protein
MKPLIFISHKHVDRAIANVIRGFVTEQTGSRVSVFQSSDPTAKAPRVGLTLNAELRKNLWEAGAVFLVYTSPDQDWGYCMWECGVATLPNSPDTKIVVFQCADAAPDLFAGQVLINARDRTSIAGFVTQFMTDAEFLPRTPEALTGYNEAAPEVQRAATRFFDDLNAVLPEGAVAEWPAHPYVQLQLPSASAKALADAAVAQRDSSSSVAQQGVEGPKDRARSVVLAEATISDSDKTAHTLFGMAEIAEHVTLQRLYDTWRAANPKATHVWIDSLIDQIVRAAQWQFPILRWSAMKGGPEGRLYTPVLTRARRVPVLGVLQFDVYFYPFNLLDATLVENRMIPRPEMFCRHMEADSEGQVRIMDLLTELDERKHSRVPFVGTDDRLVYIAHRSMLEQFIARQARTPQRANLEQLTLADLFAAQPELRSMFSSTAAFVGRESTLGEAKLAMNAVRNCYDVFVTETGGRQEPVLGWITDVIIAASEPA